MENETGVENGENFLHELQDCAKLLVEKLQSSDYEEASTVIHALMEARDRHMFQSVCKLTRGLHSAIVNFHIDGDVNEESGIQDASDRLNYVIDMTSQAANKTMDMVEASAPIAMNLGQEATDLKQEWQRLRTRDMNADEFRDLYKRMDDFFDQMGTGTEQLNTNLQNIILEQGFQDLTGQVLSKVINLIRGVEKDLVDLVRIASQVEEITGFVESADTDKAETAGKVVDINSVEAEGPQIHADKRNDVVSGQDDVDDLLSSLGF